MFDVLSFVAEIILALELLYVERHFSSISEHDFRWVFITRFLMQQGVSTVTG